MSVLPCKGGGDDPLLKVLRETFDANPLRVPEARTQPLAVVGTRKGKIAWIGPLADVVEGELPDSLAPERWKTSEMADVSVRRTRSIDIELGLTVLEGFLAGFGAHSPAIATQFKGAKSISFSFSDVLRTYVDIAAIGRALAGTRIDRTIPSNAVFFGDDPWRLNVIDSTIASSDFSLAVTAPADQGFTLQVPVIQGLIGDGRVSVNAAAGTGRELKFQGTGRLTFAYSCVRLYLDEDGRVTSMPAGAIVRSGDEPGAEDVPSHALVNTRPGLIEWDSIS